VGAAYADVVVGDVDAEGEFAVRRDEYADRALSDPAERTHR